jgi:hypothetical protein
MISAILHKIHEKHELGEIVYMYFNIATYYYNLHTCVFINTERKIL